MSIFFQGNIILFRVSLYRIEDEHLNYDFELFLECPDTLQYRYKSSRLFSRLRDKNWSTRPNPSDKIWRTLLIRVTKKTELPPYTLILDILLSHSIAEAEGLHTI